MDDKVKIVLKLIKEGKNILLHGFGGTGKTWSLKEISLELVNLGYNVANTATTGVAALNLFAKDSQRNISVPGSTLHSWAGIGLGRGPVSKLVANIKRNSLKRENWNTVDVLIIDEISMMGSTLFDKLFEISQRVRNSWKAFGGITLVVSGDFLQLPPVNDDWVFSSPRWDKMNFVPVIFDEPKRFDDLQYFEILKRVRTGDHTPSDENTLRARMKAYEKLKRLMDRATPEQLKLAIRPTILYSLKRDVYAHNMSELKKLTGNEVVFTADDNFDVKDRRRFREETYKNILDQTIPEVLVFKIGAQVMLKINDYYKLELVNGSRGVVVGFDEILKTVRVRFINNVTLSLEKKTWENEDKIVHYTRNQIPLILAYSCTIHKAQGSTLDFAECDLGTSVFSNGQSYVALSRVRNLQGLFLSNFTPDSILTDNEAYEYVNKIENQITPVCKNITINEGNVFVKIRFENDDVIETLGFFFLSEEILEKHQKTEFKFLISREDPTLRFRKIVSIHKKVGDNFSPDHVIDSFPNLYLRYVENNGCEIEEWCTYFSWEANRGVVGDLSQKLIAITNHTKNNHDCNGRHKEPTNSEDISFAVTSIGGLTMTCKLCTTYSVDGHIYTEEEANLHINQERGKHVVYGPEKKVQTEKIPEDLDEAWDFLYKGGFRDLLE